MLAKMLRPNAAERGTLVDHIGLALVDRAMAAGLSSAPETSLDLAAVRRSIVNAYDLWWRSLAWWQVLWLSGSLERRFRSFTDHARECGLLDKWIKRAMFGIHAVA